MKNGIYENLNFLLIDYFENWYGVVINKNETILTKVAINYEFTPQKVQPSYDLIENDLQY